MEYGVTCPELGDLQKSVLLMTISLDAYLNEDECKKIAAVLAQVQERIDKIPFFNDGYDRY